MRTLILGGDGYLGWPTAMALSAAGHDVCVVDNYLRRNLARAHNVEPLQQVPNLPERARLWNEVCGKDIVVHIGDCCDKEFLARVVREVKPEALVHYAEQPSAPYSMLDHTAAELTLLNNLHSTLNVVWAVHAQAPGCHIIKLGTMGEYGTPNIDIEEGWIDVEHKGRKDRFLFPRQAGSLYHTTKIQDTDLLWFYVRVWGLRVTDLMQGPVYGVSTDQTRMHDGLATCFAYDEIFGTVLNRFVVQAVAGIPLTVYGRGGQTRGYLNLIDTLRCVELALTNPPPSGSLRVFNQFTESFSVNELAGRVVEAGKARGYAVTVDHVHNPRVEAEEHYYNPTHTGLTELGLEPNLLTEEVLHGMFAAVEAHRDNIDAHKVRRDIRWSA